MRDLRAFRRTVDRYSERTALVTAHGAETTYGELGRRTDALANALDTRVGDARTASLLRNSPAAIEMMVAAQKRGRANAQLSFRGAAGELRRMVETAERTGQTLAVDYNYRHMPSFATLKRRLDSGDLGDLHLASADAHAYGWHHTLDLLTFLFGEPRRVRAALDHDPAAVAEQFRLDDVLYVPSHAVSATIEFESGTLASVASSIHTDLDDHLIDLAVYGDAGRVRLTGMTPDDSTGTVAPGPLAAALRDTESITLDESFTRSIVAFVEAMAAGEEPPTTGEDGLRLLTLERAMLEAAATDGWVDL